MHAGEHGRPGRPGWYALPGWLGLIALRLAELAGAALLAGLVIGVALYVAYSRDLPDVGQLATHRPFETTRIYARDGQTLLYELFDAGQRTVVTLDEVPWAVKAATIAVEDAGFYANPGVDLRGIVRAFYLNRQEGAVVSGGSTITQQLARNVLLPPEERAEQSYRRKIREAILALQISRRFSKDQILQFYLNEVYYGNQAYGIEAAAQNYFSKPARELTLGEAALLAGLVQAPTELNPLVAPQAARARQRVVLDLMVKQGLISRAQADAALAQPLVFRPATVDIRAPHWVFYVLDQLERRYGPDLLRRGGLRVITTLDPRLQEVAETAVRERIAELRARDASNAAVVIIDPRTSEILAMVGSANYNDATIDGQVNVATAPRQPGSALKPIVYAAALMRGWTPATIIWDTPLEIDGYRPQNYDNRFHGPQRLRYALANSYNIPAVRALQFVGIDAFLDLAQAMGITTLQERERYGLAVALGAGEVTLLDLTTAYTTLANGGRARPAAAILKITTSSGEVLEAYTPPPGTQVLGPQGEAIAYLITDILSDNQARTPMFGPNSVMRLADDRPAAVKTGTSNDYRDSWAVGYTPELVVGAWVGNSDNRPMQEVAGANGAGTIWRAIMERAHAGRPPVAFTPPPNVVERLICPDTGLLADGACTAVPERFVAGMEPRPQPGQYITLTVGGDGTCLATDQTPPEQRRERTFLLPPPGVEGWNGVQPPTQPCPPPEHSLVSGPAPTVVAAIDAPSAGAVLDGEVSIVGSAAGMYTLAYGAGAQPEHWTPINSGLGGVAHGLLGRWSAGALPEGIYTLRLQVSLPGNPPQEARVTLRVARGQIGVRLLQPAPDARLEVGATVSLLAETSGAVSRVEFLVDGQVIGSVAASGSASWRWLASEPGRHTLEAAAYDPAGRRVSSPPISVVVGE